MTPLTHESFKERLEEIANKDFKCGHCGWDMQLSDASFQEATQSLITIFEDFTKNLAGEFERNLDCGVCQGELPKSICSSGICLTMGARNELRQTINQTSKTILRGSE